MRNFAIPVLPFEIDGHTALLAVQDRDAILVRSDVAGTAVPVPVGPSGCRSSLEGCNCLPEPFTIVTALGPIAIERGFTAVDLGAAAAAGRTTGADGASAADGAGHDDPGGGRHQFRFA